MSSEAAKILEKETISKQLTNTNYALQSNLLAKDRLHKLLISSFLLLRTHERLGGLGADIGTGTEHSLGLLRHLRVREVRVLETGGIEDRGREVRPGEVGALELGAKE